MKRILGVSTDAAGKLACVLLAAVLACGLLLLAAPAWAEEPGQQGQLETGEPDAVATDGADGQGTALPDAAADEGSEGVETDVDASSSEGAVPDAVGQAEPSSAAEGDAAPALEPEDTPALTPLAADDPSSLATLIPRLQWAKGYGGVLDEFNSVTSTLDGGSVAVGSTRDGQDAIIVKFDTNSNLVWSGSYGGSGNDCFNAVIPTSDGGFVVVGYSSSSDGDFPVTGWFIDAIIVKFDANGNLIWSRSYGGAVIESFTSVTSTLDGCFVAMTSPSVDGLSSNGYPIIVKFDANGTQLWSRSFVGSEHSDFVSVAATSDGGFVAVGYSGSPDGDFPATKGFDDAVIAKFDANGNKLWSRNYGGSDSDTFESVTPTSDGGFVAVGFSYSEDGDLPAPGGYSDAIIAKFDANGNKVWARSYGGSYYDFFLSVTSISEGGYVAVGWSGLPNNDPPNNKGRYDAIVAKFDANGNPIWSGSYGGSGHDSFSSVLTTPDGGYVAVGASDSPDGDFPAPGAVIAKFTEYTPTLPPFTGKAVTLSTALAGGRNIDIPGRSTKQGEQAIIWSDTVGANQRFYVGDAGGGAVYLQNVNSGLVLDINGANISKGAAIIQWPWKGTDNQKWYIEEGAGGSGTYVISSALNPAYCLDIFGGQNANGAKLILWERTGGANQSWDIAPITPSLADGTYTICTAGAGNRSLDVEGASLQDGARMLLWDFHGQTNQQFTIHFLPETGYYTIVGLASAKSVDVFGNSTASGTQIIQWQLHGQLNQQWSIADSGAGNGTLAIIGARNNLSLDVYGGNVANNGRIIAWPYHGQYNQQWLFDAVG